MSRVCTVCTHKRHAAIDAAIVAREPNQRIATAYGLTESAIRRHKKHIPEALATAQAASDVARADSLLDQLRGQVSTCHSLLRAAEKCLEKATKDREPETILLAVRTACHPLRELRGYLDLVGQVTGELQRGTSVQVQMRTVLADVERASTMSDEQLAQQLELALANVRDRITKKGQPDVAA